MRGSWSDPVLLSICFNSSLYKTAPRSCLASGDRRGRRKGGVEGEKRGERRLSFLIPGFCRACGGSSQRDRDRERKRESRASFSPGRKEEFPLASDCLTCKNVVFVAGLRSFFWQAVCDQLSAFPPLLFSLSLFLCRFTCLPPTQFLWILLGYSYCRETRKLIGLPDTVHIVRLSSFIPVQYFP